MLPILTPSRLVEVIERRASVRTQPVLAYWYSVAGNRDQFAQGIRSAQQQMPIVPLIPRRGGMLEAPNALVSDLVQLIDESRADFAPVTAGEWPVEKPLVVLILSRSPMSVPGGSSPTPLPEWLPRVGGTVADLEIEDLTFSADAPLNCSESAVPVLCEALFTLEVALVARLRTTLQADPSSCQEFFSMVAPQETPSNLITVWEEYARSVKEPSGFRPSVRSGTSFVAQLVGLFCKTTPDRLSAIGSVVAKALRCESNKDASLLSVLFRPTQQDPSIQAALGRNVLVTVYAGYQYVTATAHADAYPHYPVSLIHALSTHLAQELDSITVALEDRHQ